MNHEHERDSARGNQTNSRAKWVLIGFIVIAAYLLVTEHSAHVSGWLSSYGIWLLLLACPLMHLFMHGGHGHGGHEPRRGPSGATGDRQNLNSE